MARKFVKDELDELAREFLETMIRVNSRFREESQWRRSEDLSLPQFMLLHHLYRHGPARSGEVARSLRVSQGVITRMVDRLVEKGLVTRSRDPEDRRVVLLSPTTRGKRLVDVMERQKLKEIKTFLRSIPPREKSDLLDLFRRIKEFLEREPRRERM
ncbi:MarR family transcriptional regulator [Candidatus Solincola tengchongensis]|uniref:MarR family winged helix-turn-helix transcriptional regulator n=1 Tax=Candidatus Solincola tengchongensis TaxID=2900693 RepID=UPI002580A849|nr:MarR family transcriptional regulator [Candidatus Solincola tengchongensis]